MSLKFAIGFGRDPRPGVAERDGFFPILLLFLLLFPTFVIFYFSGGKVTAVSPQAFAAQLRALPGRALFQWSVLVDAE